MRNHSFGVVVRSVPSLFVAILLGLAPMRASAVTVAEERADAMEVLRLHEVTGYAFSTCRWIRRRSDAALLERYRRDNSDIVAAARVVIDDQGGLTQARRKVVDSLAAQEGSALSASPADCDALFERTRAGGRDLASLLAHAVVRRLMDHRETSAPSVLWILEERRRPDGTLGKSARPWEGKGTIAECDEGAAAKGHVWTRAALGAAAVSSTDPDLWLAECVLSATDPVMEETSSPSR